MFISKEADDALHKRSFSRLVTGASMVYVAIGLIAVGAVLYFKDATWVTQTGSDMTQKELSPEQKALIEARIAGGDNPPLSDEQREAVETRIADGENLPLTEEQKTIIEARMTASQ